MVDLNDQYHQLLAMVAKQFGGKDPAEQQGLPMPPPGLVDYASGPQAPPQPDPYQSHLHEIAMAHGGVDPAKQPQPAPALQDPYTPPPPNTGAPGAPYGAYRQEGRPWTQMQFDPQGQFTGISGYRRPDSPIPAAQPQAGPQPAAPQQGPTPTQHPVNGAGYGSGPAYGSGGASARQAPAQGGVPILPRPTTLDEARNRALSMLAGNPRALDLAERYAPQLMQQMDGEKAKRYQQEVEAAKLQSQTGARAEQGRHNLAMEGLGGQRIEANQDLASARLQNSEEGRANLEMNEALQNITRAYSSGMPAKELKAYVAAQQTRADAAKKTLDTLRGGKPAADSGASQAQGPAKIANDAEYEALPAGSLFVGPDGKTRKKP